MIAMIAFMLALVADHQTGSVLAASPRHVTVAAARMRIATHNVESAGQRGGGADGEGSHGRRVEAAASATCAAGEGALVLVHKADELFKLLARRV